MLRPCLRIIRSEHEALSAMLTSIGYLLSELRRSGKTPPFEVLRAMLFYLDEFPERLHHRKETELLFPTLRQRCPADHPAMAAMEQLDRDHQISEVAIRDLTHALLAYEMMGEPRREGFEQALDRYVSAYRKHMALEETVVLPAARDLLLDSDWQALDAAFEANRDPMTGHPPDAEYVNLFSRIVHLAPAPIGLGKAL